MVDLDPFDLFVRELPQALQGGLHRDVTFRDAGQQVREGVLVHGMGHCILRPSGW